MSEPAPTQGPRARNRAALIVLVLVAAATCLALGYWQWSRFESSGGTGQNLGYALQWPLFAGFTIYAYRHWVRLEREHQPARPDVPAGSASTRPEAAAVPESAAAAGAVSAHANAPANSASAEPARRPRKQQPQTEIPDDFLPARPRSAQASELDAQTQEYNRYLAELAAHHSKGRS